MNTYLIPWYDDNKCDILKMSANSYENCQDKIIEYYSNKFDDDELAGFTEYDEFLCELERVHHIYLGDIHEIEEYE